MKALAFLLAAALAAPACATPVFKVGCVASYDTTASVPVIYGGNYPWPDSLAIFKFTIDYDATIARYRAIENIGNGWTQVVVNDNLHSGACAVEPPLRRLTVMIEGSWDCIEYTLAEPMCWIRFGRVGYGTTVIDSPPGRCPGSIWYTEGATCVTNLSVFPEYLGGGCVVFGDPTDVTPVERRTWTNIKALYR